MACPTHENQLWTDPETQELSVVVSGRTCDGGWAKPENDSANRERGVGLAAVEEGFSFGVRHRY